MRASRSRPARPRRWRLSSAARSTCGRASYATRISPSSDAELGLQLELLAVHSPAVLLAAGLERDLFAAHLAFDRYRALGRAQRSGQHLVLLLERQFALRRLIGPRHPRRDNPEERGAPGVGAALR